jgi:hypothetical protein
LAPLVLDAWLTGGWFRSKCPLAGFGADPGDRGGERQWTAKWSFRIISRTAPSPISVIEFSQIDGSDRPNAHR